MKRYIRSASRLSVLRDIERDLKQEGKDAKVNNSHSCVDVFDDKGNLIEQHYASIEETHPTKKRYKYVKADPPGTGEYNRIVYDAEVNDYSGVDHLIKYVNKTNSDKVDR